MSPQPTGLLILVVALEADPTTFPVESQPALVVDDGGDAKHYVTLNRSIDKADLPGRGVTQCLALPLSPSIDGLGVGILEGFNLRK